MVSSCCIKGCRSESVANSGISFHALPRSPELRKKWLKFINRPNWKTYTHATVCSKHFEPKCFGRGISRTLLLKDSIPSLIMPLKPKRRPMASYIYDTKQQPSVRSMNKTVDQNTIQLQSEFQLQQNQNTERNNQAQGNKKLSAHDVRKEIKCEILVCRGCLATDARFASLGDSKMQAFRDLAGTAFSTTDDLPQIFCALCRTELSKFVAFRDRCQRASELLCTLKEFGELTYDAISAIDRNAYKLTHNLNRLSVYRYNSNELEKIFAPLPIKVEDEDDALESDHYMGLETLNGYNESDKEENNDTEDEKDTFETDFNDTDDEVLVEYLDGTEIEKDEISENYFHCLGHTEREHENALENFNDIEEKTKENEENETLDEVGEEQSNVEYLEMEFSDDEAIDKNFNTIIEQAGKKPHTTKKNTKSTKKKACKTNNDHPNFDSAEFEKKYQVKITVLELEEQLKEIEDRKTESRYLKATFKCESCGKRFKSDRSYKNHMTYHDQCDKTFSNAVSFDTHTVRKHRERVRRRVRRASPRRGKVVCEICGRFVQNESVLRNHQLTHAAVKPFKCTLCPRAFAAKITRDFHLRTHTGERPYQCEQCPLAFALKCNLTRHQRVVHLGQRHSFPCDLCGKTFTRRDSVKLHVATVHNGMPWPRRERRKKLAK